MFGLGKKKEPKIELISDFFKLVDVVDISSNPIEFRGVVENESDTIIHHWLLLFDIPKCEFGVFYGAIIYQFDEAWHNYNILFQSTQTRVFPIEIIRIIKYLTDKYGVDISGKGYATTAEIERVMQGQFWTGRMWLGQANISYGVSNDLEWDFTLYGNQKYK